MNCQHFETMITDLARDHLMEAATRERGLSHAETCARCAARLADERTLTAGLQATASAQGAAAEAPARVESALRAAFRRHADATRAAPAGVNSTPATTRRWSRRWMAAAAAAVVFGVVFALTALRSQEDTTPSGQTQQASVITQPSPREEPIQVTGEKLYVSPSTSATTPVSYGPDSRHQSPLTRAADQVRRPARRGNVNDRPNAGGSVDGAATESSVAEITTDFLPLTHEANLASMNSGQVVRVEMPRSALVSFGLPMNMERSSERVKADVLLGEDGVARAIRFVR